MGAQQYLENLKSGRIRNSAESVDALACCEFACESAGIMVSGPTAIFERRIRNVVAGKLDVDAKQNVQSDSGQIKTGPESIVVTQ